MRKLVESIPKLIISILLPLAVGFISSLFIRDSVGIYENLVKPDFAPPGWLFGPVWTVLYIMMGIAAYRVWTSKASKVEVKNALLFYGIQLALNFLWSILFFKLSLPLIAFIEIVLLLIFILITTVKFYKIDKLSGYLMVPYILWVTFATILNFSIWLLNRI